MHALMEIGEARRTLDAILEECDGDITDPRVAETVDAWYAEIEANESEALDRDVNYIRWCESRAAVAQAEADFHAKLASDYTKKAKGFVGRADWRRTLIKEYLQSHGRTEVFTSGGRRISIAGNGGVAPVRLAGAVDPATIPDEFVTVKRVPDMEAIRKYLTAGGALPFAELGVRGSSLRIR